MASTMLALWALLVASGLPSWLPVAAAMRPDHMAKLRKETVAMFYHGYGNYMEHAFPEDEVRGSRRTKGGRRTEPGN